MEVFECIRGRRDIRAFKGLDIPDEAIRKILEAAVQAPSAGNVQDWEFVVVRSAETRQALAEAALGQGFIAEAPVVIVACSDLQRMGQAYGERGVNLYSVQDTAAATQNLLLAAWGMGIGGCWVGAFSEKNVAGALRLPGHVRPLAIIPLGVPDGMPPKRKRRRLEGFVHGERY